MYPNGDGRRDIPDSTEEYVDWVWQTYETTGDVAQLASLYPVVKNVSDYVARAIDPKTGLVTNLPGGGGDYLYGLVDWPPQMRYGYDMATAARTTENVLAVDVFRLVAADGRRCCTARSRNARPSSAAPTRLTTAMQARLRRPDGVFVDGLEAERHAEQARVADRERVRAGVRARARRAGAGGRRLRRARSATRSACRRSGTCSTALARRRTATGAFVAALTDPNRPGYAQILQEGATYAWESWDARQTGDSESHAFGSNVLTIMQEDVLGVSVTAPGGAAGRRADARAHADARLGRGGHPARAGSRSRGTARRRAGSRSRSRSPTTSRPRSTSRPRERRPTSATVTSAIADDPQVRGRAVDAAARSCSPSAPATTSSTCPALAPAARLAGSSHWAAGCGPGGRDRGRSRSAGDRLDRAAPPAATARAEA